MATVMPIALDEDPPQPMPDRPGTEDLQVILGRHPFRDPGDESIQVFQSAWLARVLRAAAAAVTNVGIVAHVAGVPAMRRNVR